MRDGFVVTVPIDGCISGVVSDCNGSCLVCHHAMCDGCPTSVSEAGITEACFENTSMSGRSGLG